MEITGRLSRKGLVALSRDILEGVNQIFQEALLCQTEQELGALCLRVAEDLTQSQASFIGLLDPQGLLLDIAISNPDQNACQIEDPRSHQGMPSRLPIHGLYGRVLRDGQGFFSNSPATHPDSIGLPPGHPPLAAFLGVPLLYNEQVIGMIGVANRAGGYRNEDLFTLNALSVAMVQAIKHKQTDVALRTSEEQFRALFESTSVALATADPANGHLLSVNNTYTMMLGYTLEDLAGRSFSELTHPQDREWDWAGFCRMVRGEIPSYSVEKRVMHKDGHAVWCLVTVNLVRDASGQPVRSVAVILDISGRKQMEEQLQAAHQALERAQNFLEAVFDALPVGVCITDEQGGVIRNNHMVEEILGSRPVIRGVDDYQACKAWWVETGERVQPEEWAAAQAIRTGRAVLGQHVEVECTNGKRRIINNSAAPVIDDHGKVLGSAVAFQDITTQWQWANELNQAKLAAEEASRAKSDFLANMSHEIRTPMTVFMSAIEQLQHIDRNPEHHELLDLAEQSSQRLYTLVNEILDFSKIEARQMDIDEKWFDLRACLQETAAMMNVRARNKKLRLEFEIAAEVPEHIVGDSYRLGQILLNLVGNAIKFTDQGKVHVAVQRQEDSLEFTVSDTGIGIAADKLEKIFETFSQADSSSTRSHGGTGLGLAISRGLVTLMGGTISVRSEVGKGSVFTFTMPIKNVRHLQATEPGGDGQRLVIESPEAQILLVEDNPMVREVVLMSLARRPWQTTTAENGRDAVRIWQDGNFDVILMDLQMPDMDGLEATREIRRLESGEGKQVGIIGLTAHADRAVRAECLQAGMNDVLVKPFETVSLYQAIKRQLAG